VGEGGPFCFYIFNEYFLSLRVYLMEGRPPDAPTTTMKSGNRKSIRLPGHDYSGPGNYFVTLVTENRECLFGWVIDGEMHLNNLGWIVQEEWVRSPQIRSELDLDRWIIMPNHFHGIVFIRPRRQFTGVVGAAGGRPALERIRKYIEDNPRNWREYFSRLLVSCG